MVGAIAVGTSILPKVFQGGLKLFKGIGKKLKGIGKSIKKGIQKRKDKRNGVITPEVEKLQTETTTNTMENEQIDDSGENTQKAFLGLQSVEAGKKQQSKIIMIAGAVVLLLFFMMKKK